MRLVLALIMLVAMAPAALAQIVTPTEMLRSSVTNVVRPQMKAFAVSAARLSDEAATLCAEPSPSHLEAARDEFAAAAAAYGRVEFLRLGPLVEDNRSDRLLFWPDRRSLGLRQVQQILAEQDSTATEIATLKAKSVAAQGFGALEFVLFGTDAETLAGPDGAFRCAYGRTIARNIAEIAGELVDAWADPDGIAARLMQPSADNADYRTQTESLEALVGVVAHGVEAIRDTRVSPFIGRAGEEPRPRQALFWRSGQTVPMLRANVEGLRRLVDLSGIVADPALAAEVAAAFDRASASLDAVTAPPELAVADPAQMSALSDLVVATQDLQQLIGEQLSGTLGLSVGFSSLDGD